MVSVLDVAPLLFYLRDLPIPTDLEGELRRGLLRPGVLAARPPKAVDPSEIPELAEDPSAQATSGDEMTPELREKLRTLGYVE